MAVDRRCDAVLKKLKEVLPLTYFPDLLFVLIRKVAVEYFVASPDCVCFYQYVENGKPMFDVHEVVETVHVNTRDLHIVSRFAGIDVVALNHDLY
jgi:hypothetical protein